MQKPIQLVPQLNSILLPQPIDAPNNYPSPVYQVLNVTSLLSWKVRILPNLQNHDWNNGTNEGCQLGGEDLRLLPLPVWSTNVAWAIVEIMASPKVS